MCVPWELNPQPFFVHIMKVNGVQCCILNCVSQKKEMHAGLELQEGEYVMTEFSFWGELSLGGDTRIPFSRAVNEASFIEASQAEKKTYK